MRPGMTVLPARAMDWAPVGTATPEPAATMRPSRTTTVALAMAARSVPSINRRPVNAFTEPGCWARRPIAEAESEEPPTRRKGAAVSWATIYDMSRPRTFPIVLAGFTAFLDLYATQPLLPLLMRAFAASHLAVSLTVTASTMAVALGAPVVGRLADLVGRKRVIVASSLALAAATGPAATPPSLGEVIAW